MSSPPTKQKKITSLSFSQQSDLKDEQMKHFRQYRSHQQKNRHQEQKSMKEKASLNKMLSKSIDEQNQLNQSKGKPYLWQILLIDEKRTLTGIKVRIKCNMIPGELYVVIRLSFTLQYFRLNGKLQQGTVFIQLDELNFQTNKVQKRQFQTELEKQMKPILCRTIYAEDEEENKWVAGLFNVIEGILEANRYQKRQKRSVDFLNRKEILTKYILYHPPVCLTWSPKGSFCLTENKVPANKTSFIGNPLSFKLNIEVPKVSHLNTVNQQQLAQTTQQSGTQLSIFSWDTSEELELFALNNHKRQLSSYYKDNSRKDIESKKKLTSANSIINPTSNNQNGVSSISGSIFKPSDTMILKCSSKMTPTMKKIYERYFTSKYDYQYEIARGQKLNVYFVLGQNRRHQDQMLYLMERINIERLRPPLEVILSHMLASHPNLLSIQQGQSLNTIKYFVISQLFKQQNCKHFIGQFNLSTCLKSVMVQNQYHSLELENYLTQCFKQVGSNNAKLKYNIYELGSYLHFDEYKAEQILMKLLEQYEYHYELNLKNEKQVRFILQSKNIQRIKKHIKIKRIVKFPSPRQDWLLTDQCRKLFVQTILPVLIIRDRNYQDFYYRQLERIIATNQKILKFYKNLSQIIKKIQQERHDFIKNIVNEFSIYEKNKRLKEKLNHVRRQFTVYCQKCQKPNKTFQIDQAEKLRICNQCLQTVSKKI